ncbi:MAG: hypothetical protein ROZ37_05585 [Aromatoleum sp.]|jgi:hypothetical protein|uniref:hypothetical protein n=1 Tax=Aromatoleum sp. TaxID=2307007 RepID=UPI002894BC60|nr:hypothetical protein [Aromatoleum sp.]MDT3669790.1 hypothetical protein [Aromatoleum sp.]
MRQVLPLLTLGIAVVASGGTARAWADEAVPHEAVVETLVPATTEVLFVSPAVDDAELADKRGGADTHLSEIRAVGTVNDVSVLNAVTGSNTITEGALAGASGIPMVIQNSGNGVLIQNATIVNLEMK